MLLTLLLTSIATLTFDVSPVEATETIYIRADGSIEPSTANITRDEFNVTYTFTDNNYDSIVIERDNIILDGAGFTLQTNSGNGISLSYQSNVTIKDLNIDAGASYYGIYPYYSTNITIFNCSIYLSSTGISLDHSSYNDIYGNRIERNGVGVDVSGLDYAHHNLIHNNSIASNSGYGIRLGDSRNSVYRNNITDNAEGISVIGDFHNIYGNNVTLNKRGNGIGISFSSPGGGCNVSYNYVAENTLGFFLSPGTYQDYEPNTLKDNILVNNSFLNFGILNYASAGDKVVKLFNDMDISNTVNGKPIYYWINRENDTVPSDAGFVALINCRNITVENLTLEKNLEGVLLAFSNNITISGNNITDNGDQLIWGGGNIVLHRSSNNSIYNNNITTSHWTGHGIVLADYSSYNVISENNLTKNSVGVWTTGGNIFNNISRNDMKNNKQGIRLSSAYSANNTAYDNDIIGPGTYGIYLGAERNTISGNNIIEYQYGVYVTYSYNTIVGNNIMENWGRGIFVDGSFNTFVENNIMNNDEGVYLYSYGKNNLFFHNNLVDNAKHVTYYWSGIVNSWNNSYPIGGNYWSGYEDEYANATELDNSGLWDTPYVINENNIDYYPLMAPTRPITRKFPAYDNLEVEIYSNSSISEFQFNLTDKKLSFNVTGSTGTRGFCNVTIPANLLWGEFSLFINDIPLVEGVNYSKTYNDTHYIFHITYTHSEHIIEIVGTEVIPEFPSAIIILLLMALTMLAVAVAKRRRSKNLNFKTQFFYFPSSKHDIFSSSYFKKLPEKLRN
jgi:parallel beta-helix repeat protein